MPAACAPSLQQAQRRPAFSSQTFPSLLAPLLSSFLPVCASPHAKDEAHHFREPSCFRHCTASKNAECASLPATLGPGSQESRGGKSCSTSRRPQSPAAFYAPQLWPTGPGNMAIKARSGNLRMQMQVLITSHSRLIEPLRNLKREDTDSCMDGYGESSTASFAR